MSSQQHSAVIQAIGLPDNHAAMPNEAALDAIKNRVESLLTPAASSGPPPDVRVPPPELRAIGAPKRLNWKDLKSFPVLLADVRSVQREWEVDTSQNSFFLVANLDSGAANVIAPIDHGRRMPVRPPSRSGPPPDASEAGIASIDVVPYDLMKWYSPQQMQGRLAITAFDYDLITNTARVDVTGGPGGMPVPAQSLVARTQPATTGFDTAGHKVRWPAEIRKGEGAAVHVELKLPRERVALVESPAGTEPALAASLLMLQLDKSPVLTHFRAAVKQGNGFVTASFDVDLNGGYTRLLGTGDWMGYLVIGDSVIGPHPFSVSVP